MHRDLWLFWRGKNTKQKVFSTFVRCAEGALERKFRKLEDEYSRRKKRRKVGRNDEGRGG